MQIAVYDNHSHGQHIDHFSNTVILGMHSFAFFLASIGCCNRMGILLRGSSPELIEHVLWNEFYSHTLLKDIRTMLATETAPQNSYLKTNHSMYRLSECLEWEDGKKIRQELVKQQRCSIEAFTEQGQTKYITIQFGEPNNNKFDIILSYGCGNTNTSQTNPKPKTIKDQISSKSVYKMSKTKEKQRSNKYLTQKKRNLTITNKGYKHPLTTNRKSSFVKYQKCKYKTGSFGDCDEPQLIASNSNSSSMNKTLKPPIKDNDPLAKQDLVATLLTKKQQKLKQCQLSMQQQQLQFQTKIKSMENAHEHQMTVIQQQVQTLLQTYKHKNKDLRKQNRYLVETNNKLNHTNNTLETIIVSIQEDMRSLQEKQDKLEKSNQQYCSKLERIEKNNVLVNCHINQQLQNYQSQIKHKETEMCSVKKRYNRLLGNLKLAASQVEKENIPQCIRWE